MGNPIKTSSLNKFSSEVFYDSLFRAERIILPGAYRTEGYYDSTYTNCSTTKYPSLDGSEAGYPASVQYCSDNKLYAFGFNYTIGETEGVNAAFLHFTNPYGGDDTGTIVLDSIVLNFYADNPDPYFEVNIGKYETNSYSCDSDIPAFTSLISDFTVTGGWNSYTLIGEEGFTFGIRPTNSNQRVYIYSNDNSTNKPYLEVFYKLGPETIEDSTYSIRYDYTDVSVDNVPSSVQSTIRKSYSEFGQTRKAIFDGFGRAEKSFSFDSGMTTFDSTISYYDYMDRAVASEDQLGNVTETEYNILGENTKTIFPDSNSSNKLITYSNATATNVQGVNLANMFTFKDSSLYAYTYTDENGAKVYEYKDVLGRLRLRARTNDSEMYSTCFDYDEFGNNNLVIKPEGDEVHYQYNNLGWLLKEWAADYDTIFYEYDKAGRVIATKHGNLSALEDDTLTYWSYNDYDAIGRVLESGLMVVDSNGVGAFDTTKTPINEFIYDQDAHENSRAKLSLAYTNDDGYEYGEEYHYDARGRLISQVNHFEPEMDSTLIDSLFMIINRESGHESAVYVIEREGLVHYDLIRCITQRASSFLLMTLNDTMTLEFLTYDSGGYYDSILNETIYLNAGDEITVIMQIDGIDAPYATISANIWYEKYTQPQKAFVNGHEFPIEYEYNQADQLTKLTYPDGSIVTYDYDDRGRLLYVGDGSDQDKYALFDYSARSEVVQMILGPDAIYDSLAELFYDLQTIDYDYNARGWLNSINSGTSSSTAPDDLFGERLYYYGHADSTTWPEYFNGNIGGLVLDFQGTNTYAFSYIYDSLDRLKTACYETDASELLDEEFTYDKNGNVLSRHYGGSFLDQLTYNYTSGTNQLSDYVTGSGRLAHTSVILHDAYGNMAFDIGRGVEYKYDIYNQLDTAKFYPEYEERLDLTFGYNTSGLRIYKDYHYTYLDSCDGGSGGGSSATGGGGIEGLGTELDDSGSMLDSGGDSLCRYYDNTKVIYIREKPGGKVIAEYDDKSDSLLFTYIYAGDTRIAMRDRTGSLHFYLTDHLGSTRIVLDSSGTVKDHYDRYYAFGDAASQTVSTDQKFRYTSKPYDDEGPFDLYYYGARYYDAKLGRFPAIDPLRNKYPGWSPYQYTMDNPINSIDPDGRYTDNEWSFALKNPIKAAKAHSNKSSAIGAIQGLDTRDHTPANAIQHAVWSALNAKDLGYETAIQIGMNHEQGTGDTEADLQVLHMDLTNNEIGATIGAENSNLSDDEIIDIIFQIGDDGGLQSELKQDLTEEEKKNLEKQRGQVNVSTSPPVYIEATPQNPEAGEVKE